MPASYHDRMLRVLDYIHENPAGDLSLDRLADVAAMSRFHWHRVFYGMTGETCAQAVRRVRLHRAACLLVQTDASVAYVAKTCGYDSVQAFSRGFRVAFGMSPSAFRVRGDLRSPLNSPEKGERPMFPVETTTTPALTLAALPHKGPYLEVGQAFEKLQQICTAQDLWPHVRGMTCVYYDDPNAIAAADLRSHAGVVIAVTSVIPEMLERVDLPVGRTAVMHYKGPYAGLKAAYDYLYGVWLPQSGEETRDAPPTEVYLNGPHDTAPDDLLTDICVPIR